MNRQEAKGIIQEVYNNVRPQSAIQVLKKNKELVEFANSLHPQLQNHSLCEKCYWILYDLYDFPICDGCKEPLFSSFSGIDKGYRKFCSRKCATNSDVFKQNMKDTMVRRYGVEYASQCKEIVDRAKKTMVERYGVEYACQSQLFLDKSKQQYLEHYGVDHPMKSAEVKMKMSSTCMDRYGVSNPAQIDDFYDKFCQTMLSRYGDTCAARIPQFIDKSHNTIIERYGSLEECKRQSRIKYVAWSLSKYGVVHPFKCKEGIANYQKTCMNRFGCISPFGRDSFKQQSANRYNNLSLKKKVLQHLRMIHTNRYLYGVDYVPQSDIVKRHISDKVNTEEFKNKVIHTNRLRYGYDWWIQNPKFLKHVRSRYFYDNLYFDSSWEVLFYKYLKDNGIEFIYHPDLKFEYHCNNEVHYYHPDFKIGDEIIELKGDQFFDENGILISLYDRSKDYVAIAKHQCIIDNNVIILRYQDLVNLNIFKESDIKYVIDNYKVK